MYGLLSDRDCPRFLHFDLMTMNKMTQIASTNAPVAPRTIIPKNNENLKHKNNDKYPIISSKDIL